MSNVITLNFVTAVAKVRAQRAQVIQFPVSPLVYIRKARREEQQSFITRAMRKHALERRYSEFVEYVGNCEAQKMFAAGKSVGRCLQTGFRIMDLAAEKLLSGRL